MARDMDFKRPPRRPEKVVHKPKKPKSSISVPMAIIIILGIGALSYGAIITMQQSPSLTTSTTNTAVSTSPSPVVTAPVASATGTTTISSMTIKIYDAGGGAASTEEVDNLLKQGGFKTDSTDKAQYEYDKTYVWYRKGLETQADQIKTLLKSRDVALKESKLEGVFDILVFVGKT